MLLQNKLVPLQHISAIAVTPSANTLRDHVFAGRHRLLGTQIAFPNQLSLSLRNLQHLAPLPQPRNNPPPTVHSPGLVGVQLVKSVIREAEAENFFADFESRFFDDFVFFVYT